MIAGAPPSSRNQAFFATRPNLGSFRDGVVDLDFDQSVTSCLPVEINLTFDITRKVALQRTLCPRAMTQFRHVPHRRPHSGASSGFSGALAIPVLKRFQVQAAAADWLGLYCRTDRRG